VVTPEDGPVPLGAERLDAMLAGGLRPGELCGLYADPRWASSPDRALHLVLVQPEGTAEIGLSQRRALT